MLKGTLTRWPTLTNSPVISWPRVWPSGGGGPPADHVLVAPADVGRHHAQDDAVLQRPVALLGQLELGVVEVLDLHPARTGVDDALVGVRHWLLPSLAAEAVRAVRVDPEGRARGGRF